MSESNVGTLSRAPGWRMLAAALPEAQIASVVWECAAIVALTPLLLAIAAWNGFPITFYDTGAYILQGLADYFVPERAPAYSYFLKLMGARESLWLVAGAQCAIIAFAMVEFARVEAPKMSLWRLIGIGAFLVLFTGIGWVSGEIEPDCFTAVVALTMWLVTFRARALGATRVVLLMLAGAIAISAHPSHMGLAAGLSLVAALYAVTGFFLRKHTDLLPANPLLPIATFVLGIGLVVTANYALTKHVFLSRSGPVFMTARMIEDGVAKRVLDDMCPQAKFVLCRYKDHLPATADDYLWESNSPFNKLGRFRGSAKESQVLMAEGFKRYPFRELGAMLWNGTRQFFMFRTGDGIAPQEWVLNTEFKSFLPHQMKAYATARQQKEEISFVLLNIVHVGLAGFAMFVLAAMVWNGVRRRDWREIALPVFLLVALLGNAMVCGATSGPHDRYQGRMIWVPVFVLAVLSTRNSPSELVRQAIRRNSTS
jgi:hypothetical protein